MSSSNADNKRSGMLQFERPKLYDFDENGVARQRQSQVAKQPQQQGNSNNMLQKAIVHTDHLAEAGV